MADNYVRQSSGTIQTGLTATAASVNAEFNKLEDAFDGTDGHDHSGGTGLGPKINLTAAAAVTGTLPVANGGTGATTFTSGALLKGAGTSALTTATAGTDYYAPGGTDVAIADGGTGASSASDARTNLGLGTMAVQDASSVTISGGTVTGITDLALADGGTGASLTDPNADRIMFWDDSAGAVTWLTAGTGLTISGTTITASGGSPYFDDDGGTPSVAPSATGTDAIAIGDGAAASAEEAFAYGGGAVASGGFSIAFGGGTDATNTHAIAIGRDSQATNSFTLALGSQSTASASAAIAIGRDVVASGTDSITVGRLSDSTGTGSIAIGGDSGTGAQATNDASIAIGRSATASGSLSIAIGGGDTSGAGPIAAHTHSIALGRTGRTRNAGQVCYSNTVFSTAGDSQWSRHLLQGSTTNNTPTEIGAGGSSSNRIIIPSDSTFLFRAYVVARRTDADNESAGYVFTGVIDNNAGTTALVSTVTSDYTNEDTAAWAVAFTADNTNDALVCTVTGETAKTIRWVVLVETLEVIG